MHGTPLRSTGVKGYSPISQVRGDTPPSLLPLFVELTTTHFSPDDHMLNEYNSIHATYCPGRETPQLPSTSKQAARLRELT